MKAPTLHSSPGPAGRLFLLAASCLLASCSGPRLQLLDTPVTPTPTGRALTSSTALMRETRDTLRAEDLLKLYASDPGEAIQLLHRRHARQPTGDRRTALAEMLADTADTLTGRRPAEAVGHYLDAARICRDAALASLDGDGASRDRDIYNYSAGRIARLIQAGGDAPGPPFTAVGPLRSYRFSVAGGPENVHPSSFDLLVPGAQLKLQGIRWPRITQPGFGEAMVGLRKGTDARRSEDPMMSVSGHGLPLNATVRFSGARASLVLQDMMLKPDTQLEGRRVPLAADFTAALASIYYERERRTRKFMATLRPARFEDTVGIYSIEPFREDKIPLVLVHGLLATAEGWLPFVNLLRADPAFRENYQIIAFNYPTGNPIGVNSAKLREALAKFRRDYDPAGTNPHLRKMVILGHSMGGILSNVQIRNSGTKMEGMLFEKPIRELDIGREAREELERVLLFQANPDIDRAVFIAAPHRGSAFATNPIGLLGAWLIRLPFNVVDDLLGDIEVVGALTDAARQASQRPANSVNSLRPDNPVLGAILKLPVRNGVSIHSIIARRNPAVPLERGGDGVVPYASAHLGGVASEKVIPDASHNSVLENDGTIEEVWRILRIHAGQGDR